jgi:hypothetical protein
MTFLKWVAAALLMMALPMTAAAQSDSGRISGTVLDQTGAYVTGASVTVKNQKTGETRTATTNDNGYFVAASLKPSTYTITVQKTLEPVSRRIDIDRDVRPAPSGGRAVPVLLARMNDNGVAAADFVRGFAPLLYAHAAVDDEQPLWAGVRVPVRATALLELDAIDVHWYADVVQREALGPRGTGERIDVRRGEGDRVPVEDIHRFFTGTSGRGSLVNPLRFGIFTSTSVAWSMTSCSLMMPFMNST